MMQKVLLLLRFFVKKSGTDYDFLFRNVLLSLL
jgi:hypothetical protein